jgi:hypothetical protein
MFIIINKKIFFQINFNYSLGLIILIMNKNIKSRLTLQLNWYKKIIKSYKINNFRDQNQDSNISILIVILIFQLKNYRKKLSNILIILMNALGNSVVKYKLASLYLA